MKKALCSAAVLALLALGTSPAAAQNRARTGEFGIHGGYIFFDTDLDDHASFGATLGINATDHVEIEFQFDRVSTQFSAVPVNVDINYYALGFLWNFHPGGDVMGPHVPYLTVGGGTTNVDVQGVSNEDDFDFWYVGGGYRYFWNEHWGFRWDARAIFTGTNGDFGETDNTDVMSTIGVSVVFGGGK